ncbi:hypothetical protein B0A65_01275 [Flavobacterium frigidimaris]|uniref:Uncharacterized protein n=1 Tax=Flavobacterium frigidimaris TaxID=262320 RepID=A0ABX4BWH5_FLAFR|nr:hypothetical protein B0A65_01275 [Flavobacterium frigidimaris]
MVVWLTSTNFGFEYIKYTRTTAFILDSLSFFEQIEAKKGNLSTLVKSWHKNALKKKIPGQIRTKKFRFETLQSIF